MLAIEDYIAALDWAADVDELNGLIARATAMLRFGISVKHVLGLTIWRLIPPHVQIPLCV